MRRSRRNGQLRRTSPGGVRSQVTISISSLSRDASADDLAERIGDEAAAPELDAVARDAGRLLVADAVDRGDVDAVGDRVRALDGLPGRRLAGAVLGLLRRVPADRGRVEEHVRARQRGQPRRLRVPLVPADQRADAPAGGVERAEAEVAGREVELLVEERVVRDVHLAVAAQQLAVGVDDHRGVVVDARGAPLEQRRDDHDALFARGLRRAPRSSAPGSARRDRSSRGPPPGRSTGCGTARAGRPASRRGRPPRRCARGRASGCRRDRPSSASARGRS